MMQLLFMKWHLEKQIRKSGISYFYRTDFREDGKKITKRVYLGTQDRAESILADFSSTPPDREQVLDFGGPLLLEYIANLIHFKQIFSELVKNNTKFDVGEIMTLLVISRLLYPESKYKLAQKRFKDSILLERYNFQVDDITEDLIYHYMDYVYPYLHQIQSQFVNRILKIKNVKFDEFIIDGTSFASYGNDSPFEDIDDNLIEEDENQDSKNTEENNATNMTDKEQTVDNSVKKDPVKRKKGYSRAKRPDLAQINFMMGVNGQYIPFFFEAFAGNILDIKMFSTTLKNLKEHYPSLLRAYKKKYIIFDRGNWNQDNSDDLTKLCEEFDFFFVAGIKSSHVKKKMREWDPEKGKIIYQTEKSTIYAISFTKKIFHKQVKVLLYFSPKLAQKKLRKLNEKVKRIQDEFNRIIVETNRSNDDIYARTSGLIKKYHASRLFKVFKEKEGENIVVRCQLKEQGLQNYKDQAGKFALITNNQDLSKKRIYEIYLTEHTVEQSFHLTKHLFQASRIFHHNSQRIEVHLAIVSWGLLLLSLLKHSLKTQSIDISFESLLEQICHCKLSKNIYHYPDFKTFEISRLIDVTTDIQKYLELFRLPHDYFTIKEVPTF